MNDNSNPSPDQAFPDETPRPVEASQETQMERQENKLDAQDKGSNQEAESYPKSEKTMSDLQEERRTDTGDSQDDARAEGPYGVQEVPEQ
jgi:type IV secretory pathway VirB10-like protein